MLAGSNESIFLGGLLAQLLNVLWQKISWMHANNRCQIEPNFRNVYALDLEAISDSLLC